MPLAQRENSLCSCPGFLCGRPGFLCGCPQCSYRLSPKIGPEMYGTSRMAYTRTLFRRCHGGTAAGHRGGLCVHTGLRYSPSRKLRSERCLTPRSSAWMGSMLTANPLCVCPSSLTIQGSWIMIFPEYDSNLISLRIKQPFYRSIVI